MKRPFESARVVIVADPDLGSLVGAEREIAETFDLARRRAEWVAGRAAARAALGKLLGPLPSRLAVASAGDGAPELQGLSGTAPSLSISHGHGAAIAVCGFVSRIGVDLCDLVDAPRVERVSERFISEEERELARAAAEAIGHAVAWASLWALKEAGAKALRQGLFHGGLDATRLSSIDPPRFETPSLEAQLERDVDAVVAVVWER